MSALLFEAGLKEVQTGLMPGLHKLVRPLWDSAQHIDFDQYGAHAARGLTAVSLQNNLFDDAAGMFDSASGNFDDAGTTVSNFANPLVRPVLGLMTLYKSDKTRELYVGYYSNIYKYTGGAVSSVGSGYTGRETEAAGRLVNHWQMFPWGDWVVANNGVEAPQVYKGTGSFAAVANLVVTTAELAFKLGPHAVLANTSRGPNYIEWCAEDNLEAWDPASNPTAGRIPVRDISGPFIAAEQLGDAYGLYTTNELVVLRYGVTQNFRFGALTTLEGIGALGKKSIISVGPLNYGLTRQGIFVTDGATMRYLTEPVFGTWLERNLNWDQKSRTVGYFDKVRKQLRWSVPLVGSTAPNYVICFNLISNMFGPNSLPFTTAVQADVLEYPLVGFAGGQVMFAEYGDADQNGVAITRELISKPLDLGSRITWKDIHYIQCEFEKISGSGVSLYAGWQEKLSDSITWTGPYEVNEDLEEIFPANLSGVFISLRFVSTEATTDWIVSGFKIFGMPLGGTI